jgi:aldehyde:ferredoxin oxidoreductase
MEAMMHGWMGKVLRVDLHRETATAEDLDPRAARDYVGGRGLGIHYLNRECDPGCDALGPENLLVLATGPLTATGAQTGARYMIMTKSPLTGAITCSNSGGRFPTELKRAGYDAVLIKGRAQRPCYIWIDNGKAEIRPATHLWGKTTHETTDQLLLETDPGARAACIGPAGENLVLFASVMNDKDRAAGRSGVGAVFGSKNLKALAVRGGMPVPLADEQRFRAFNRQVVKRFKDAFKDAPPPLRVYGTAGVVAATQAFGVLPTKNWQQGTFEGWEGIYAGTLNEKHLVGTKACFSCPLGCGRVTEVKEPGFEGRGEGPEYETIYAMGSNCMIDDLAPVIKANYLCNELGLDTISMGATVACAMELFDRGHLSEAEIGGPLRWGDGRALVDLTRKTAYREGFGDRLARGSFRLASECNHPELAMVSKKQEFPGYEPRGAQGMGLAYATSPIGGSHMRGDPAYFELLNVPTLVDPVQWKGKAELVKIWQDMFALIDSAGLCVFFSVRNLFGQDLELPPEGIMEYLNAATGAGYSMEELRTIGERIINAERVFLNRAGFSRKEDSLPERLTREPLPDGPAKGSVCRLDEMLDEYYRLRGWDENGFPANQKLRELGFSEDGIKDGS